MATQLVCALGFQKALKGQHAAKNKISALMQKRKMI
jgi:hypothetical protein